jgi:hypothetical protein
MTINTKHAKILAASAVWIVAACTSAAAAEQPAESSFWCRMFPSFCGNEGTPAGTQHAPDMPAEGATRGLEPAAKPEAETAPPATSAEEPEKPANPPAAQ